MTISSQILMDLSNLDLDVEQLKSVLRIFAKQEEEQEEELGQKRENARLRKQKQRQRNSGEKEACHTMSHDVTVTDCDKKTKKKKEPKKKKIKNNIYLSPRARGENSSQQEGNEEKLRNDAEFKLFWKGYPRQRRGGEKYARTAWNKVLQGVTTAEEIMDGLRRYGTSSEVARGYAKGAAAWLNDDRWTVEYTTIEEEKRNETDRYSGKRDHKAGKSQQLEDELADILDEYDRLEQAEADSEDDPAAFQRPEEIWHDTGSNTGSIASFDPRAEGVFIGTH